MNAKKVSDAADSSSSLLIEIVDSEKQLSALIRSKGLLHPSVKELYYKIRASYESILLNDYHIHGNDVEYSLWKLHYIHIDEFRRKLRKSCATVAHSHEYFDSQKTHDNHLEAFKLFLAEITEYYVSLITKIRQKSGVIEEPLFHKNDGFFHSIRAIKVDKYRFSCHCFLVCLGDLARYREFYEKSDIQICDWSTAASYYMEATRIWPQSGNPHNQLALLATYVGDEFLALYHCVRSLAVREPFPDTWDNLFLLFEKNRDTPLSSLSSEAHFNFSKPSERSKMLPKSVKTGLWSLFVRVISFFYIKSRLEDFNGALSSTTREMEAVMALDGTDLRDTLDTYQYMSPTRIGPFRTIHMVSILIFLMEDLTRRASHPKDLKYISDISLPVLTQLAWTTIFVLMARIVDRCAKSINDQSCSALLPAVVIFSEWLVGVLDKVEAYGTNKDNVYDIYIFFDSFVDFLNRLDDTEDEVCLSTNCFVLWEDYELQGFEPLAHAHEALNFSDNQEYLNDYFDSGGHCRMKRILNAATKMARISRNWILYDKNSRKFCIPEKAESENLETVISKSEIVEDVLTDSSIAGDEEEIILFKPISGSDRSVDTTAFGCTKSSFSDNSISPGPPSLNAWVLNNTGSEILKNSSTRIESSSSSISLAPFLNPDAEALSGFNSSPPRNYIAPIPSAPLLPDDSVGYCGDEDSSKSGGYYTNCNPIHGYPYPPLISNTSFERFQQYKHGDNVLLGDGGGGVKWPGVRHYYSKVPNPSFAGFDEWGNPMIYVQTKEVPMYRGLPVMYGADMREKLFHGFKIPCGGGGGAVRVPEQRGEQLRMQVLQCLKEKEWERQREARQLGT